MGRRRKLPPPNFVDRCLSVVAPGMALKNWQNRAALAMASSTYTAADKGDLTNKDRTLIGGGIDRKLDEASLWDLREISRELDQNNGLAVGLLDRTVENVVGPEGFQHQPNTGNEDLNKQLADDFEFWLENYADGIGETHGWELFGYGKRTEHCDGDIMWHLDEDEHDGEGALFAIEGHRVFTPRRPKLKDSYRMKHGFVLDRRGRRSGMWVSDESHENPWANANKGVWLKAGEFLQWKRRKRINQTRGEPTFTPVIKDLDDRDELLLFEKVGAKLVASQGFWIETDQPSNAAAALGHGDADGERAQYCEPGQILYGKGKAHSLISNRPSDNFDPFVKLIDRTIGLPLGLPYELVTLDFSHVNFAASRNLLNQAWRHFRVEQVKLGRQVKKIYLWWLKRRIARGFYASYQTEINSGSIYRVKWGYPGWPSPNPVQDAQAAEIGIRNLFQSRTNYNRQVGVDQDQIFDELNTEQNEIGSDGSNLMDGSPVDPQTAAAMAANLRRMSDAAASRFEQLQDGEFDPAELSDSEFDTYTQLAAMAAELEATGGPTDA